MVNRTSALVASIMILGLATGAASAQTAAPAAPAATPMAAPAAKAGAKPRTAKSIQCSSQADQQGLHGKPRHAFMGKCKAGKA